VEIQHITEHRPMAAATGGKTGFWQRQFAATVTRPQTIFDVIFGVIGPTLCFVFDPVVFRSSFFGPPLLPEYQVFAYLFSALQITLLSFWLLIGSGWQPWNKLIGGMFLCGALFCLVVGLGLAPFSLIGLAYGIGVFGLTPFLTALVYLRNSSRALKAGTGGAAGFAGVFVSALGILLASGLPLLLSIQIHWVVSNAVTEIVQGDPQHATFAAHRLAPLRFFADAELDRLVNVYWSESDEKRKELIKSCYREITGESIENRPRPYLD
jgi:hypothetical protein